MDIERVVEKILADAADEAAKIKKQADGKDSDDQAWLRHYLDEYKKETQLLAQKAAREKKSQLLAAARLNTAAEYLAEKRKIIDEVFIEAKQQLQNIPDADYRKLMSKLMLDAVETGDEEVVVDKNEKRIDQEFIRQINQQLAPQKKGSLRLSGERQNLGAGFILRRGKIKNNVSIEVLLAQARKELEIELAKELFS